MMSFRVGDKIDSRRDDDVEPIATRRVVKRDRAVVSRVRAIARWRAAADRDADGVDGRVVRAEDRHRLERPSHGSLWRFVQDLHATDRRVDRPRHLVTDPRVVPGQAAWRGSVGLVAVAGRLQSGESPAGRTKTGPNPTDRGRSGSKHCVLTDATGTPLVVQTVPANQHDVTTMLPLVVNMPTVAGKPGRPKRQPNMIVADKAFDYKSLRSLFALARHRTGAPQTQSGRPRARCLAMVHRTHHQLAPSIPTTTHSLGPEARDSSSIPDSDCRRDLLPHLDRCNLVLSPSSNYI